MSASRLGPDGLRVGPPHQSSDYAAIYTKSVSVTPSAVATIATAEQTVTVAGVRPGDLVVIVDSPARTNSVLWANARVSANDTIAITYVNPTAGSLTPPAGTYKFLIIKPA